MKSTTSNDESKKLATCREAVKVLGKARATPAERLTAALALAGAATALAGIASRQLLRGSAGSPAGNRLASSSESTDPRYFLLTLLHSDSAALSCDAFAANTREALHCYAHVFYKAVEELVQSGLLAVASPSGTVPMNLTFRITAAGKDVVARLDREAAKAAFYEFCVRSAAQSQRDKQKLRREWFDWMAENPKFTAKAIGKALKRAQSTVAGNLERLQNELLIEPVADGFQLSEFGQRVANAI